MQDIFERRLEDPIAAAIRLAEKLIDLPPEALCKHVSPEIEAMDDFALQQFLRVLQIIAYRNKPISDTDGSAGDKGREENNVKCSNQFDACRELLSAAEEALNKRRLATLSSTVPSVHKLQTYITLLERFTKTMASHTPARAGETIEEIEQLLAEAQQLLALEPVDYLNWNCDLVALVCDVLATNAGCFKELGDIVRARTCLERAIHEAEAHSLEGPAGGYRLKLADLLSSHSVDFNEALSALLSLRQSMSGRKASLARARIMTLLSEAYVGIGDFFEAGQTVQAAKADLQELGYPLPDPGNPLGAFVAWSEASDRLTTKPIDFREALYGALTAFMSIANIESKTLSSPDQQACALALTERETAAGRLFDSIRGKKCGTWYKQNMGSA